MSYKGHNRRPTSLHAAEILETPSKNHEKTYRAADGQILQSSMVKSGSPSKRQITGSVSQVRFSLPPPDSDYSFDDDDELDIVRGFEDSDDFEKRSIFNLGSRELEAPIRGRSTSRSDTNDLTVADSMRHLVSTSPERNRLFIRGNSELNSQQLPIPVELQIPPLLSPKNKGKKRPTSLIFNGVDYEPFEVELASKLAKTDSVQKSLPTPTSPRVPREQIEASIQPLYPNQSAPKKQTLAKQQRVSAQIEIPDLNKPYQKSPVKPKSSELDNEKEIENPSEAAKQQNNQLNKRFSFPPALQQPASGRIKYPEPISTEKNKTLPALPSQPKPTDAQQSNGLGIFTEDGPLKSQSSPYQNSYGRFATTSEPTIQSQPQVQQQRYDYHYPNPETVSYVPPVSRKGHYHRRSKSQIIDFPVDKLDELPKTKEIDYSVASDIQPERDLTPEFEPEVIEAEDHESGPIQESTPESQYSNYDENKEILPPPPQERFVSEDDVLANDSIQSSVDIANNDKEEAESIHTVDSVVSEEDDPNQLLDLGRLIISSRSEVDLNKAVNNQRGISHSSITSSEPSITEPLHFANNKQSIHTGKQPEHHQPLGSQHQPQIVRLSDNFMPEHIRQISQSRIFVNREKSRQIPQQDSPNPSHSSYESEFSEPFSVTSSTQTAQTSESIHRAGSIMVDLTNDNYDITIKKDDRNTTLDLYKSTFDEVNGKYRETIVLDDDDDDDENGVGADHIAVPPLNIRHKRSKSALGNLEFDGSNRAFSNFSFETVASEVQLHYNLDKEERITTGQRYPLKNFSRTYTAQNKSVIELCDDTMNTTRQVLDELKRQRTILMSKKTALMNAKKKDEERLLSVRELQANLMKTRKIKPVSANAKAPRPKSYVYGEDSSKTLQQRQESNSENYFDYKNNQSYNFETFMRSQSSSALI